jgi:hypothetical protein
MHTLDNCSTSARMRVAWCYLVYVLLFMHRVHSRLLLQGCIHAYSSRGAFTPTPPGVHSRLLLQGYIHAYTLMSMARQHVQRHASVTCHTLFKQAMWSLLSNTQTHSHTNSQVLPVSQQLLDVPVGVLHLPLRVAAAHRLPHAHRRRRLCRFSFQLWPYLRGPVPEAHQRPLLPGRDAAGMSILSTAAHAPQ